MARTNHPRSHPLAPANPKKPPISCPRCATSNRGIAKFCRQCGAQLIPAGIRG